MAITEDIYARCRLCLQQAAHLLDGEKIDAIAIQARRKTADIAQSTFYAMLKHAFITPIDREDLWLIHTAAEHIHREAENTALRFCRGEQHPSSEEETIRRVVAACCTATEQIMSSFPALEISASHKRILREAECLCHAADRIGESAYRVVEACERFIIVLQYAALKNT